MDLSTIKEKLGPLPIWAWGVIVGVILLLAYYIYNREKTLKTNTATVAQDTYSSAADGLGQTSPPGVVTSAVDDVETNQTWLTKAVNYLSTQGFDSADATVALQSLLSGVPVVGDKAKTMVTEALDRFGVPPDLSAGIPTFVPDPTPTAGTANTYYARDATATDAEIQSGQGLYKVTDNGNGTGTKQAVSLSEWESQAKVGTNAFWKSPTDLANFTG